MLNILRILVLYGVFCWFGMDLWAQPANDDLANAAVIGDLPFFDGQGNSEGTLETGEVIPSCDIMRAAAENSLWWQFTPEEDQTYTVRSPNDEGSLSIWTGEGHPLQEIACDSESNFQKTWWEGEAGTSYWDPCFRISK